MEQICSSNTPSENANSSDNESEEESMVCDVCLDLSSENNPLDDRIDCWITWDALRESCDEGCQYCELLRNICVEVMKELKGEGYPNEIYLQGQEGHPLGVLIYPEEGQNEVVGLECFTPADHGNYV